MASVSAFHPGQRTSTLAVKDIRLLLNESRILSFWSDARVRVRRISHECTDPAVGILKTPSEIEFCLNKRSIHTSCYRLFVFHCVCHDFPLMIVYSSKPT